MWGTCDLHLGIRARVRSGPACAVGTPHRRSMATHASTDNEMQATACVVRSGRMRHFRLTMDVRSFYTTKSLTTTDGRSAPAVWPRAAD